MLKSILVLPDGSEISSGTGTVEAIASIKLTQSVNNSRDLNPGAVCAAMLEAKLITPGGSCDLQTGDEVHFYREEEGVRRDMGIFILEEPLRPSANTLTLTAFDRVSRLDKDLTGWLAALTGWPYTLEDFAAMVCTECGLELEPGELPNGAFLIPAFTARDVTGRQLMQWIAQAAGRFCRATPEGKLEFAWYTPAGITLGPSQGQTASFVNGVLTLPGVTAVYAEENLTLSGVTATEQEDTVTLHLGQNDVYYYMGGLQYEDYAVAPIEKVQVKLTDTDVGAVYPDIEEGNTCILSHNPLLTASMAEALEPVAENLYEQLRGMTYTPCTITMPACSQIRAGHSITVAAPNGGTFTALVMTKVQTGQKDILTCTGNPRRDSTGAVNELSYKALSGKVLELQTDLEGLRAENRDAAGNFTRLELDLQGIRTEVARQQLDAQDLQQSVTQLLQDEEGLSLQIQKIRDEGVSAVTTQTGFTFDAEGLHVEKSGDEIATSIDHTGMEVSRAGETVLQATAQGVKAIDITVRNYLVVGSHARMEDYSNGTDTARTACFFI